MGCTCGGQTMVSGVGLQMPSIFFWDRISQSGTLPWKLLWVDQELLDRDPVISCHLPQEAGIIVSYCHAQLLNEFWGSKCGSSQELNQLSYFHSSVHSWNLNLQLGFIYGIFHITFCCFNFSLHSFLSPAPSHMLLYSVSSFLLVCHLCTFPVLSLTPAPLFSPHGLLGSLITYTHLHLPSAQYTFFLTVFH